MADTMGAQAKHPPLLHTNAICKLASVRREQPVALAKHMFSCWRHPARKASVPPGFCLRFALDETKILYHKTPRGAICKISEKMFPFCRETGKNAGKQPRTQAKRAACGGPFCLEGWESIKRLGILFDTTSLQHSASLSNAEKRFFLSFVIYTRLIS